MRNLFLIILTVIFVSYGAARYQYAEVEIRSKDDIKFLQINNIDIDRTSFGKKGSPIDGKVTVYVTEEQFSLISSRGCDVVWTPMLIPKDASDYRYNEDIGDSMLIWQNRYPDICKRIQIGTSVEERPLWVLKITDNVDIEEAEPEVKFVSTMHGDEVTGMEMEMLMIENILKGYQANNDTMQFIVNNTEFYLMPLMNPDGMANYTRYNSNGYDLNRNFPEGTFYDENSVNASILPEIDAMINWSSEHNFILSTNYHGGAEVVNYLYDKDFEVPNYSYAACEEDEHVYWLAYGYASRNPQLFGSLTFTDGITNGCAWYSIDGGMQDWNYRYNNDVDMTLEISGVKWPSYSEIPSFWEDNRESMFWYLSAAHKGVYGVVADADTGQPLNATIEIAGIDKEYSTDPDFGDYYRVLKPGTYSLTVSAPGYVSQTINNITVTDNTGKFKEATEVNVQLVRSSQPDIKLSLTDTLRIYAQPGSLGSSGLLITNQGDLNLNYSADITYNGLSNITVEENDFESGPVYTNTGTLLWNTSSGGVWNDYTTCALLNASGGGSSSSNQTGELTSGIFDGSVYSSLTLEFDQTAVLSNSTVSVEIFDGTWNSVYSTSSSITGHQKIALPQAVADMQLRFSGSMRNRSGDSWRVDNVIINGQESALSSWLKLNGENSVAGIVAPSDSTAVSVDHYASGLDLGEYSADICVTSNDPQENVIILPVVLTVTDILSSPVNVTVMSVTTTESQLSWDAVSGATLYKIFRSSEPYSDFTQIGTSGTNSYTDGDLGTGIKYFYYVTADNSK